jgi:hypothetical protein
MKSAKECAMKEIGQLFLQDIITSPTGISLAPSGTKILARKPSSIDSISKVALSCQFKSFFTPPKQHKNTYLTKLTVHTISAPHQSAKAENNLFILMQMSNASKI